MTRRRADRTRTYRLWLAAPRSRTTSPLGESRSTTFDCPVLRWPRSSPTRLRTGTTLAITADNNGPSLPSLPIIPVVHSEGSGSTYQFTAYLANQFPSLWTPFNGNPNPTEYFPRAGSQIAQNGSDGVMNFIRSKSANGAIGFDEYSYGLRATRQSQRSRTQPASTRCRRSMPSPLL